MPQHQAENIEAALAAFRDPVLGLSLDSLGRVTRTTEGDELKVQITLGIPAEHFGPELHTALQEALESVRGSHALNIAIKSEIVPHAVQKNLKPISKIKNIIAVASAKGGVGKSTTAANLALALAAEGAAVGILDADIYGPSQPRMLGLRGLRPTTRDGRSLEPLRAHGLQCMSIGFLIDEEQPMVWRGPMVTQALTQMIEDTQWGELDYLIVDMPPGTGDTQLTLAQRVPLAGAVIVTTPQEIALLDARKGLAMFRKVEVAVLGIVENMAAFACPACGHESAVFGEGGGARMAEQYEVPLLGSLPLEGRIREQADGGVPTVVAEPESTAAATYRRIALGAAAGLARAGKDYSRLFPKIVIEE